MCRVRHSLDACPVRRWRRSRRTPAGRLRPFLVLAGALLLMVPTGCGGSGEESQHLPHDCVLPHHTLKQWREDVLQQAVSIRVERNTSRYKVWQLFNERGERVGPSIRLVRVGDSDLWESRSLTGCL
jgi:hypothetical protein